MNLHRLKWFGHVSRIPNDHPPPRVIWISVGLSWAKVTSGVRPNVASVYEVTNYDVLWSVILLILLLLWIICCGSYLFHCVNRQCGNLDRWTFVPSPMVFIMIKWLTIDKCDVWIISIEWNSQWTNLRNYYIYIFDW